MSIRPFLCECFNLSDEPRWARVILAAQDVGWLCGWLDEVDSLGPQ